MVLLRRTLDFLPSYTLSEDINSDIASRLEVLGNETLKSPESRRWKLRSLFGERISWWRELETTDVAHNV